MRRSQFHHEAIAARGSDEFIATLHQALDRQYARLREMARAEWEKQFAPDPSDGCATVRISGNIRALVAA